MLALLLGAGVVASGMLARAVERSEERALARAVEAKTADIVVRLGHELQTRLLALSRMADRWRVLDGLDRDAWEEDAANYVAHYGGFRAIEVIDADGRIEWVVPDSYTTFTGMNLYSEPKRRMAMDAAWLGNRPSVAAPVELYSVGTGILVFLPLYGQTRFDGWLGGVFHVQGFLAATLGPIEGYRLRITSAGEEIYADPRPATQVCSAQALGVFYLGWRVEVCAGEDLAESVHGRLPAIALAVGLAFTALCGGLFVALLLASDRERRAGALAESLKDQASALERAQGELTELSWSVSHEVRTPLRAIDGYAAILAESARASDQATIERIRANAQRMARQLDGLLELLRVARARVILEEVDVAAIARDCFARHAAQEPERRVEVEVGEIRVRGDAELLTTIVDALIDNAWKFTRATEPGHISVTAIPAGFAVTDDGVGFDMAFAQKLFGPFEQLHAPGEFEGLGLGLAIAARAVGRLGGRIRAEGVPGQGARFEVCLPG